MYQELCGSALRDTFPLRHVSTCFPKFLAVSCFQVWATQMEVRHSLQGEIPYLQGGWFLEKFQKVKVGGRNYYHVQVPDAVWLLQLDGPLIRRISPLGQFPRF
jgi:hypothetical protein